MKIRFRFSGLAMVLLANVALVVVLAVLLRPDVANHWLKDPFGTSGDVSAWLRYEPLSMDPFDNQAIDPERHQRELQTAVQLITSPNVLSATLSTPAVKSLPSVLAAADGEDFIRDHLRVRLIEGGYLIEVASHGLDAKEGEILVSEVIDAYLQADQEWSEAMVRSRLSSLEHYAARLEADIAELSIRIGETDKLPLTPGGPSVDRTQVEDELRDCLRRLRGVRLRLAALDPEAEAPATLADRAALERQRAALIEERDRLANVLDGSAESEQALLRDHLAGLQRLRHRVVEQIERLLRFESQVQGRVTVVASPHAGAVTLPLNARAPAPRGRSAAGGGGRGSGRRLPGGS